MINNSRSEHQLHRVSSFQELVSFPFQGERNTVCWERELKGDFLEIVNSFDFEGNMIELDETDLFNLKLSEQGQTARESLINDLKLLRNHGASPTLNIIKKYERDDAFPFFPTDVYSYHVDRSPIPVDTFLCTYYGESSDILPNSQAIQKAHIPEIRKELKKLHNGNELEFEAFLSDNFFDLHYEAIPNAKPISLGIGNLCRLATDHPENASLPCIHRAPKENTDEPRLLLIC